MELSQTADVLSWNRRVFAILGLWPSSTNDRNFLFFFCYLAIHCCMEYCELFQYIDKFEYVIVNLTENAILTMILVKLGAYRLNAKRLNRLLMDIKGDYEEDNYKTPEERLAFLEYNTLAKTFMKMALPSMFMTAFLYYLRPLTGQVVTGNIHRGNSSTVYVIPYRTRLFFEVTELRTCILVYLYQIPIIPIVTFGYIGTDCLLVTLVLHVCGQFSVLTLQVKNVMTDPRGFSHGVGRLVRKHLRLMRLARTIEEAFNLMLLPQMIGITVILCLVGYNMLVNSQEGQKAHFVTNMLYALSEIILLFGYCFIGDCLINESTRFGNAFYNNCQWYNVSPKHLKLFLVCMTQSQNPLKLTAAKFYVFSLQSFTDGVKTSMAYLSMLRKFV